MKEQEERIMKLKAKDKKVQPLSFPLSFPAFSFPILSDKEKKKGKNG